MNTRCLPFDQVPHTTRLFLDFLHDFPKVESFFSRPPVFSSWFREEAGRVRYDNARRQIVSDILEKQNTAWNAGQKTLDNIARLRRGAMAVVTGQQVGALGGPAFAMYKALTAVKLAAEASAGDVDCVPVFWLATTDHDLAEVNHVSLPAPDGAPIRLTLASHGANDAPVASIVLGDEIQPTLEEAAQLLGDSQAAQFLLESYRPGENLGSAFARLFARLFADWGVVLLDASDPELHRVAEPIYRAAIEHSGDLDSALLARGHELESRGYHQQVKVTPSSTLLFGLQSEARTPVHLRPNNGSGSEFSIGGEHVSESELLQRIHRRPQDFSANVLLRPVLQDYLLPTLAYTGGAAETAYFAQASVVYEKLLGRVTPILPRFSATLVEAKAQRIMQKYDLGLQDLFHGSDALRRTMAARILPAELQEAFDHAEKSLDSALGAVTHSLERLDPTLVDAGRQAQSKIRYQLDNLRSRAARAEARHSEMIDRHAAQLGNALFPNKALQERAVGGISFLSRYGQDLLRQLYEAVHPDCHDHQVIDL